MTSQLLKDKELFAYQISTRYLNPQPRYYYFRFLKTNWRDFKMYFRFRFDLFTVIGWLRSTVGRTPVFGRWTDPVLRSACSRRVTIMWVNRPLQVSQLGQLSLSSFRGRQMSSRPVNRMCAHVAPSAEYLRGHGRVAVEVTALRRL